MSHYFNVLCLTVLTFMEFASIVLLGYCLWLLWQSVRDKRGDDK